MKRTALLVATSLAVILTAVGCNLIVRQEAVSFAKAGLTAEAKELGVEIAHVEASASTQYVNPAEKASGVQAKVGVSLRFAYRCPGDQGWGDGFHNIALRKVDGKWEEDAAEGKELPLCRLSVPPKNWQEQSENRRLMEKWDRCFLDNYVNAEYWSPSPFDIDHPFVREWTAMIGATWMFVPARKQDLEHWFGRKFTDEEILEFRTDPQKAEEVVQMLENLQENGGIDPKVVEFYRKALTYEGRQEILEEYHRHFSPS